MTSHSVHPHLSLFILLQIKHFAFLFEFRAHSIKGFLRQPRFDRDWAIYRECKYFRPTTTFFGLGDDIVVSVNQQSKSSFRKDIESITRMNSIYPIPLSFPILPPAAANILLAACTETYFETLVGGVLWNCFKGIENPSSAHTLDLKMLTNNANQPPTHNATFAAI